MAFRIKTESFAAIFFSVAVLAAMGYLTFSSFRGDNGVLRLFHLEAKEQQLAEDLAALSSKRLALNRKVKSMRSEELDMDLLDEQVRSVLTSAQRVELTIQ
jgi:cell division protein FtsB